MKTERLYPSVTVTPKAEAAILRGHPWVYDAEIYPWTVRRKTVD